MNFNKRSIFVIAILLIFVFISSKFIYGLDNKTDTNLSTISNKNLSDNTSTINASTISTEPISIKTVDIDKEDIDRFFSEINMPAIPKTSNDVGTYEFNNINNFKGEAVAKWTNSNSQHNLYSLNSTNNLIVDIIYEISIYKGDFKFMLINNGNENSIIEEVAGDGTYGKIYDYGKITLELPKGENQLLFDCNNSDVDIRISLSCNDSISEATTAFEKQTIQATKKNNTYGSASILKNIDNSTVKQININSRVNSKLVVQEGDDYEVKVGNELVKHAKSEIRNGMLIYDDDYGTNLSFPNWKDEDYIIEITLPKSKNPYEKIDIIAQSGELSLEDLTATDEINIYTGGTAKINKLMSNLINIDSYASYMEIDEINSLNKMTLSSHTGTISIDKLYSKDCKIDTDGTSLRVNNGSITDKTEISNLYTPVFLTCDFKGEIILKNEADLELNITNTTIDDYKIIFNNVGSTYVNDEIYNSNYDANDKKYKITVDNILDSSCTKINFK